MNKEFITIAWRNLWRNQRRTIITIASMFFAVLLAILMRSFQLGAYNHMIDTFVTQFTGQLQLQDFEYQDNPSVDYSIPFTDSITEILNSKKHISAYFPRIESGIMASSRKDSKIAIIRGFDYKKEKNHTAFEKNIVKYIIDTKKIGKIDSSNFNILKKIDGKAYANKKDMIDDLAFENFDTSRYSEIVCNSARISVVDTGVFVGYNLAKYLNLGIGDSIVFIGQGFRGETAIGKYKISGFLIFPTEALSSRLVYMPIRVAQNLFSLYETNGTDTLYYVNYVAINTIYQASIRQKDYKKIMKVKAEIENTLNNPQYVVVGWRDLDKDMVQGIEMDNYSGQIMLFVLYLIVGFGVLGTVMMMIAERRREFGVMLALGMKKKQLSIIVTLEMLIIGFIAFVAGLIVATPIIYYGHKNPVRLHGAIAESLSKYNMEPVLPFQWFDFYILSQLFVVAIIVCLVLIYALIKIDKLKIIEAIRN